MEEIRIKEIKALDDYMLLITFNNGDIKLFNFKPYLESEVFKHLKDKNTFNKVYLNCGFATWDENTDFSASTMFTEGIDVDVLKDIIHSLSA